MKKLIGAAIVAVAVLGLGTWALADPPGGFRGGHMGPGMMGTGMGPGMMGGWGTGPGAAAPGGAPCSQTGQTDVTATQVTQEKATEIATDYTKKYLPGFTVERVLPFTGMHHTMYQAELKGPKDETRTLHINPWGQVMPSGPYGPRAATQ
jgi:hypothetical protein